jgi:hypothetical protein
VVVPAELRQIAERAAPVTLAREQVLPVVDALQPLLPDGAVARGSVVGVAGGPGATSLALTLAAGPSREGSWTVVVGLPELGLAAAAEYGVVLDRLALVAVPDRDPSTWGPVIAALVGAVDVILVDGRLALSARETRRVAARARERGSVVVPVLPVALGATTGRGGGPTRSTGARRRVLGEWVPDVVLRVDDARWEGVADGHGHLRRRRVVVGAEGRGRAARPRRTTLWLPDPDGAARLVEARPEARPESVPPEVGRGGVDTVAGGGRPLRAVPDVEDEAS